MQPIRLRSWASRALERLRRAVEREAYPPADLVEREVYPSDETIAVRRSKRQRLRRENRR